MRLFTRPLTWLAILIAFNLAPVQAQRRPDRVLSLDEVLKGSEDSNLRWPTAVAAASGDQVAVTDIRESRIFFFKRIGVSWTLEQVAELPASPVDLIWERDRYVISTRRSGLLYTVGGPGAPIDELKIPAGLRPGALASQPSGGPLVYDQGSSKIVRIGRQGQMVDSVAIDEFVTGLEARKGGGWLAAIGAKAQIAVFEANGRESNRWTLPSDGPVPAWPAGITIDSEGRIYVADRHNGRILVLDSSGRWVGLGSRKGWDAGLLIRPAGLAKLPGDRLLVADQGNGRAQLFRLIFGSSKP